MNTSVNRLEIDKHSTNHVRFLFQIMINFSYAMYQKIESISQACASYEMGQNRSISILRVSVHCLFRRKHIVL